MDRLNAGAIRVPGVEVRVRERCASTNAALFAERLARPVLLATDEQTAGRGRRGRRWRSAPGCGVLFSLALPFARAARDLGGLSIVAGVAAVRALRSLGARDAALKWPNDLLLRGAKLGGILVQTHALGAGSTAVIGIGINHRDAQGLAARVRRDVAALEDVLQPLPARNAVIGSVARALMDALRAFEAEGFGAFRKDWEALHAHAGQRLRVRLADGRRLAGIAAGLADDGALQLRTRSGLRTVHSGSVTQARPA